MSPAEDYYNRVILGLIKDYEGNIHTFQASLLYIVQLIIKWIKVNFSLFKGIVSRDFEWLKMILMNRSWDADGPLVVYYF